jgi:hypothetical protein
MHRFPASCAALSIYSVPASIFMPSIRIHISNNTISPGSQNDAEMRGARSLVWAVNSSSKLLFSSHRVHSLSGRREATGGPEPIRNAATTTTTTTTATADFGNLPNRYLRMQAGSSSRGCSCEKHGCCLI